LLEYTSEAEPPVPLPNVALKLSCTYDINLDPEEADSDEYEVGTPDNIFYLEGVFLRVEP
jgi:hypothetical protein